MDCNSYRLDQEQIMNLPKRIPYQNWINSQLSIARFYGGMVFNGVQYFVEEGTNDLVAQSELVKPKKPKKKKESTIEQITMDDWYGGFAKIEKT